MGKVEYTITKNEKNKEAFEYIAKKIKEKVEIIKSRKL